LETTGLDQLIVLVSLNFVSLLSKESVMRQFIKRFLNDESGPTAVEYAVLLALIVVAAMVGITSLGNVTNDTLVTISNRIPSGAAS